MRDAHRKWFSQFDWKNALHSDSGRTFRFFAIMQENVSTDWLADWLDWRKNWANWMLNILICKSHVTCCVCETSECLIHSNWMPASHNNSICKRNVWLLRLIWNVSQHRPEVNIQFPILRKKKKFAFREFLSVKSNKFLTLSIHLQVKTFFCESFWIARHSSWSIF